MVKGGTTYRMLSDHLGSVRLVVNAATGAIAQRIDYDEWGDPSYVSGAPDFQPFGFAGGLTDRDTGLVRFGARDYDPRVGRWTSIDPIGFRGSMPNLLEYANSDPVNRFDPSGFVSDTATASCGMGRPSACAALAGDVPLGAGEAAILFGMSNAMSPPKAGAKPKNCPPGTLPIDETDLDHDTIEKIKKGVDASPSDWVGIAPDGTVVTGDEGGNAVDNGPAQSWVPWSIRK